MTVNTTANKIIYSGNAATTVWVFTFPAVSAGELDVYYTNALGVITLLSPATYTVILNAAISPNPTAAGGSVTYPLAGPAIVAGTFLTIVRNLDAIQATSLANQGTLYQPVIEQALDYVVMVEQQQNEAIGRAIIVAVSDPAPTALPPVAQRANMGMGFDASGNPTAIATLPAGTVSSAMQPVVSAASLAAGRTALGLGAASIEGIGAGLQDDGAGLLRRNTAMASDAVNQAVVAGFHLTRRIATGPLTYTLPRANTLWNGFGFWIEAYTGLVTVSPNAADIISGLASGVSIAIPAGTAVWISTDAAATGNWRVEWTQTGGPAYGGPAFLNLYTGFNAGFPDTRVDITADMVVLTNSVGATLRFTTVSEIINALTVGVNGLDAGALAANTWYYKYLIATPAGTINSLLSLSATAPTLPTGYTFSKRVGAIRTTGASVFMQIIQRDKTAQYLGTTAGVLITSGASVLTSFSTALAKPPTSQKLRGVLQASVANVGVASVFGVSSTIVPIAQCGANAAGTNVSMAQYFECVEETIGVIYYSAGGAGYTSSNLYGIGWEDTI